jgi:hypothetical protein
VVEGWISTKESQPHRDAFGSRKMVRYAGKNGSEGQEKSRLTIIAVARGVAVQIRAAVEFGSSNPFVIGLASRGRQLHIRRCHIENEDEGGYG